MDSYDICVSCACHIKRIESRCPFCGAAHTPSSRIVRAPRMSRAEWLAFGSSLLLMGCSGSTEPEVGGEQAPSVSPGASSGSNADDSDAARGDASTTRDACASCVADGSAGAHDGGAEDGGSACAVAPGTFACASNLCDRQTQWCMLYSNGTPSGYCAPDDAGWNFPDSCQACPTCACVTGAWADAGRTSCKCVELEGGIGVQCAGCYGSPPARLELMV